MSGKRRWFGWIAIGLGALALAVALLGRGFGPQMQAAGGPGANMQQQSAQQNVGPQNGPGANIQPGAGQQNAQPSASAQQNAGPQGGVGQQNAQPQNGPGANAQAGAGQRNAQPQNGPGARPQAGPGGEARRGGGRPGDGGFGMSSWLRMPFRLIGGSFQWVMLALLIGFGVWMLRGRNPVAAATSGRAEPAQSAPQAPLSPTGEAYTEEESEQE